MSGVGRAFVVSRVCDAACLTRIWRRMRRSMRGIHERRPQRARRERPRPWPRGRDEAPRGLCVSPVHALGCYALRTRLRRTRAVVRPRSRPTAAVPGPRPSRRPASSQPQPFREPDAVPALASGALAPPLALPVVDPPPALDAAPPLVPPPPLLPEDAPLPPSAPVPELPPAAPSAFDDASGADASGLKTPASTAIPYS
jgi:hypothetical protein